MLIPTGVMMTAALNARLLRCGERVPCQCERVFHPGLIRLRRHLGRARLLTALSTLPSEVHFYFVHHLLIGIIPQSRFRSVTLSSTSRQPL